MDGVDRSARRIMRAHRMWAAAAALLSGWVLAVGVSGGFDQVRIKLLADPLPPQQDVSVSLAAAATIPDPELVFIYRARNTGPAPVDISARVDGRLVQRSSIAPGASVRVDLAWPKPASVPQPYRMELTGSASHWRLESAELANLHGFTRGWVSFVVLPASQPFRLPPWWILLAPAALAVLVVRQRKAIRWVGWKRLVHLALSLAMGSLFAAAAISPWLSGYRLVLAPHTFLLGLFTFWAPSWVEPIGRVRLRTFVDAAVVRTLAVKRAVAALPWLLVLSGGALALYGAVLVHYVGAHAGGADSSGYLNLARLLSQGQVTVPLRSVGVLRDRSIPDGVYVPLGFAVTGGHRLVPTYPIGLPLVVSAIAPIAGWESSANWVMVSHALAGVLLVFWLARECGLSSNTAVLGAVMLAASPLYLFISLQLMSDTPAMVWTSLAVLSAWKSRRDTRWAACAGVTLALAVLIRPTNVLAVIPIAACLGRSPVRWLRFLAAGAPGAALLMLYNVAAFGRAGATGYGDASFLFAWSNVAPSIGNYVAWLPILLTPAGVLALGLPIIVRRAPRMVTVLILWILPFVVFYAFFFHTHETWWYLRFLLPAFPPLIVGSLWVGSVLLERRVGLPRALRTGAVATSIGVCLILGSHLPRVRSLGVLSTGPSQRLYPDAAAWATSHLPANAAIFAMQASGALFYYTNFPVLRWDLYGRQDIARAVSGSWEAKQPLYAVLFPFEIEEGKAFDRLPGSWTKIGAIREVTVWRLDGIAR